MTSTRDNDIKTIAQGRESRLQPDGRYRFDLTPQERRASTRAAMRIAGSQRKRD